MIKKSLLLTLLLAIGLPWAAQAQVQQQLLTENFDAMSSITTEYSATDWYAYNAGAGNNWTLNTTSGVNGSQCAMYNYVSSDAADCYLVSVPFTLNSNSLELGVSLYESVGGSYYPETFEVFFVKTSEVTDLAAVASATPYSVIASASYTNTSYAEQTGSIASTALADQSVRLVVHCTSAKDEYWLGIDDITVTETFAPTDPYIMLAPTSATVFTGFTTTLTATYGNVTGTPTITYSSSDEGVAKVSGSGTTVTVLGITPGTATITATMNGSYTATCAITVEEPSYCTPSFSNTNTNYGLYISGFSTEDGETNISNTGTSLSTGGYGDYYDSYSASVEAGQSFGFTVTPGYTGNAMKYAMWIDWNQDYDFNDDGEEVAIQSSGIQTDWTGQVSIPATTLPGSYRIRIMGNYSGDVALSPCVSGTYGEAEDYQLIVFPAAPCPKPTNLAASNITHTTADLTWNGDSDSYTVQKRTAENDVILMTEGFESGLPTGWVTVDYDNDGNNWATFNNSAYSYEGNVSMLSYSYDNDNSSALTPDNWLISSKMELGERVGVFATHYGSWQENFAIFYTTSDFDPDNFDPTLFTKLTTTDYETTTSTYTEYFGNIPAGDVGQQGYVAIRHYMSSDNFILFVDNFTMYGAHTDAGEWETVTTTATNGACTIEGLTIGTKYDVRVKGNCGGEYCNAYTFSTFDENTKIFITEGNWNVAGNWEPEGAPTAEQEALIMANVTIPANCMAEVHSIAARNNATITIKDGAQLKYANGNNTVVTAEKFIAGYTGEKDNYYLISSPNGYKNSTDVTNLLSGNYDYYSFDATYETEEWRNYKQENFDIRNGWGYLYANDNPDGTTLSFTGELLNPGYYYCGGNADDYLSFDETKAFGTFNLVGNAFPCEGQLYYYDGSTITSVTDFYVIDGTTLEPSSGTLDPMQGAFIQATAVKQLALIAMAETSKSASNPMLNMTLTSNDGTTEKTRIRFGEGRGLEKFQLNASSKLYIPQDDKDYAVVYSEEKSGELPVSFKAESNGSYTLNFTSQKVSFSYLHLIDNMTGDDVNLLETPYYTFNAQTTDYASRFRLVFATGSSASSDTFGFINGMGNLCIFGIEGEATLQVVDVLGHVVSSNQFSGSYEQKLNVAPGVYMLRLINGNDVKVQKMIVK